MIMRLEQMAYEEELKELVLLGLEKISLGASYCGPQLPNGKV